MNVVLYLRMSTDKQDASIPQQREALKRHADRQGYKIIGEYRDEGISGDATERRKGFQNLIRDAAEGGIDRILCFDQDRFGRFDMLEAGYWITPLRKADVSLETIAQGVIDWSDFAGRLTYSVAQEGKHQFLRDLSRNTLRGQVARAREGNGLCGSAAPYGYRRETVPDGRRRIASLVIHPAEARVVRRIFGTYTKSSGSLMAVGEILNREKIPSPTGKGPWHRNAVRRILRNVNYAGDYVWGRRTSGKYHVRIGDDIAARRPGHGAISTDPIVHRGLIPEIVSRKMFEQAQTLLDSRRKSTRNPARVRPLSGLIFCGRCGSPMHVNFSDYRCSRGNTLDDRSRCQAPAARGDTVLHAVVEGLRRHLLAPARMKAVKGRLADLVAEERQRMNPTDTKALAREIEDLTQAISKGLDRLIQLPKSMVSELGDKLEAMRVQRDALKRQLEAAKGGQRPRQLPIEKKVAECLAAAHGLEKVIASKSASTINEALRTLGLRIVFEGTTATVQIQAANLGTCNAPRPGRKPQKPGKKRILGTCDARPAERFKSQEIEIMRFSVEIPLNHRRAWGSTRGSKFPN